MSDNEKEVQSPCVGVCTLDENTGFCLGCFRTAEEIKTWWDMDNTGKMAVIKATQERESAAF